MKNPTKPFAEHYPYLAYWIRKWGRMEIGYSSDFPYLGFLMLHDMGGTCFYCDEEETLDLTFEKAEKYLREKEFPERFDKKTIAEIEKQSR
ncbi:MAG: hypothetical protein JNL70_27885 [Saprospiraceae bacterium]|nr:hypothetical protein [Saprospiraceae bacterium]